MAENKKAFVAYCDWLESFEELTDEEAGKLAKHLFRYVNDLNPEAPDRMTKMCFIPIKQSLKRDLVKYEERAERARLNGLKGGRPKTQRTQSVISEPRKPDTVKDTVTVTDTVNDKEIRELTFREQVAQHTTFDSLMLDEFADYWTESNPKGKKLKFELQKTFDIARRLKKWSSNNFNTSKDSTMELPTSYPKNSWDN
mgnify:FL=1